MGDNVTDDRRDRHVAKGSMGDHRLGTLLPRKLEPVPKRMSILPKVLLPQIMKVAFSGIPRNQNHDNVGKTQKCQVYAIKYTNLREPNALIACI